MDTRSSSWGNDTGFGSPPANEMICGSAAVFRILRMNDGGVDLIRSDNKCSILLLLCPFFYSGFYNGIIINLQKDSNNSRIVCKTILQIPIQTNHRDHTEETDYVYQFI